MPAQPTVPAWYLAAAQVEHKAIPGGLARLRVWTLEVELEGGVGRKVGEVPGGTQPHPRVPIELHGHLDLCGGHVAHQCPLPGLLDARRPPALALTLLAAPRAWAMSSRTRPMLADRARLALRAPRFSRRLSLASSCGSVFSRVDTAGSGGGRAPDSLSSPGPGHPPSGLWHPGTHLSGPRRAPPGPGPGPGGLRTGLATAARACACPGAATAHG